MRKGLKRTANNVNRSGSDLEKESHKDRCWEASIINTNINTPKTRENPTPLSAEVGSVIDGTRLFLNEGKGDGACG